MSLEELLRFDEKMSCFVDNHEASPPARIVPNNMTDMNTFNTLLIQLNDRIERQWKEMEKLKIQIRIKKKKPKPPPSHPSH